MLDRLTRLGSSSPRQTFVLWPLTVLLVEAVRRRGAPRVDPRFLPLVAWGYLQYWSVGRLREHEEAGERGFRSVPRRLLVDGPYRLTRNPMYLGHLLFTLGVALATRSPLAWLAVFERWRRFSDRVARDEARLREAFGAEYEAYCARVPRWLPRP